MSRTILPAILLLVIGVTAGCGGNDGDGSAEGSKLTVLAAASLTETFGRLKQQFEHDHAGVEVTLAFDSSTTLATQVVDGAPGDVLATADATSMKIVEDADAVAAVPVRLATNMMVLVVPRDNPAGVTSLADLSRKGVDWVMCDVSVPCGKLAKTNLEENHVTGEPASLEVDVKAVLAKVTADEADAGLVYATDATAAADAVQTLGIPHSEEHLNEYLIAPVSDNGLAREWVDLVTGRQGRAVLAKAGFGSP